MSIVLKEFQKQHVASMVQIIDDTAEKILAAPAARAKISAAQGCILLEAPTGSGKTLTISEALVALRAGVPTRSVDKRKVIWFWFAPFAVLVDQTIAAIRAESDLAVRDPRDDREVAITQDGDVFVSTWQSVVRSSQSARELKMRKDTESMSSLDTMIADLRDSGYFIGAVIDEAHHNFNKAPQARLFYLDVVRPDFTIMATATPNDEDLEQFQRFAGITRINRLSVSRQVVVDAGLNKLGVKAFYFKAAERDAALLDYDEIAIYSAVARHNEVKRALAAAGISLTPLLLVQVENYQESVDRARLMLASAGLHPDAIGVHTSAEPDKNLRALAYDETKEALIFKMSVATGFDAPRAWTLVSLRSSSSPSFGLQIIGRIMRVHKTMQVRSLAEDRILDYGHVFLADASTQSGLRSAAQQLKAIVTEVLSVTDDVSIVEVNAERFALTDPDGGFAEILFAHDDDKPTETHLVVPPIDKPAEFADALFDFVDRMQSDIDTDRREHAAPTSGQMAYTYPLRTDLTFPLQLMRESLPADLTGLEEVVAQRIRFDEKIISLILRPKGSVRMTEEDLFEGVTSQIDLRFAFSKERAEAAAQLAFRFNDSLDPRELRRSLVARLRAELSAGGYEDHPDEILRRTIDVALYLNPNLLVEACKEALSIRTESHRAEAIPGSVGSKTPLQPASRSIYPVFAPGMNGWEQRFAEEIDRDTTGTIEWWMRNVQNARWACRIVRPTGRFFYPDFVIGIAGRKRLDGIALAEVKERIESDESEEKTRVEHRDYGSALMITWDESLKQWFIVDYSPVFQRNVLVKEFEVMEFLLWR